MATSEDFMGYICEQLNGVGALRYRKMFGEYLLYVNDKPILTVCDNTAYIKKLDELADLMQNAKTGLPYTNAKEHYVLDIDNAEFAREVVAIAEKVIPLPKKKTKSSSLNGK